MSVIVYFYTKTNGEEVYSTVKIVSINDHNKLSDEELNNQYKSSELKKFANKIAGAYKHHRSDELLTYRNASGKYQNLIRRYIS